MKMLDLSATLIAFRVMVISGVQGDRRMAYPVD